MDRRMKGIVKLATVAGLIAITAGTSHGQHVGDIWCSDGEYRTPSEYKAAAGSITAKGVVYWMSPTGEPNGNRMVALKDTKKWEKNSEGKVIGLGWSGTDNTADELPEAMELSYDADQEPGSEVLGVHGILRSEWNGKSNTTTLRELNAQGKPYPAAASISDEDFAAGWFMPSMPELVMLAAQYRAVAEALQAVIEKEGEDSAAQMQYTMYYSSSIEKENKGAFYLKGSGGIRADAASARKDATNMGVRAVRAF